MADDLERCKETKNVGQDGESGRTVEEDVDKHGHLYKKEGEMKAWEMPKSEIGWRVKEFKINQCWQR